MSPRANSAVAVTVILLVLMNCLLQPDKKLLQYNETVYHGDSCTSSTSMTYALTALCVT